VMEFLRHQCMSDQPFDPARRRLALGLPLGAMGSFALFGGSAGAVAESSNLHGDAAPGSHLVEQMMDLSDPVERFKALFRFERDLQDEAITLTSYQFVMYAIAMGTRPQPVVRWQGMEFSYFRRVADWTWRIHAHNVSYPLDLVSGEFVDAVRNPLTGESVTVEPLYLLNDPGVLHGPDGYMPLDVSAPTWLKSFHVLRREGDLVKSEHIRPTPESWPQMFIESSCATASVRDFENPAVTAIPFQTGGFYVFPFPAWMKMGNAEGVMLGAWSGRRIVGGPAVLPRKFSDRLRGEYHDLLQPRWQELERPLSPVIQQVLAA
jgi:hypothetical protein